MRELEADCETLRGQLEIAERLPEERRRLLLELALCPVSEEKIARCLKAAFEETPSTGWINQQINRAGAAALGRQAGCAACLKRHRSCRARSRSSS